MNDQDLMAQIKKHNHRKDEVSDQVLFDYLRSNK